MSSDLLYALAAVGGYLLGSIPFGVLVTRFAGVGDVRAIGSGNIGATNVLRTGRKDLALLTVLGDGGKGLAAVLIARLIASRLFGPDGVETDWAAAIAGGAAFFGHLFPVWLRFRGGKGVATFFGVLLAAAWPVGALAALAWIGVALVFRISSLAALTAVALAPLFALATDATYPFLLLAVVMGVLVFVRHRANIARLIKGQEPQMGSGKGGTKAPATRGAEPPASSA